MNDIHSFQLFLQFHRNEKDIIYAVSDAMGILFENESIRIKDSIGFIQITEYETEFRQGLLITWKSQNSINVIEASKKIAINLNVCALLEPEFDNQEWFFFDTEGQISSVVVEYLDDEIIITKQA